MNDEGFGCLICGRLMPDGRLVCECGWRRTAHAADMMWVVDRMALAEDGKGGGLASWKQVPQGALAVFGRESG